MAFGLLDILKNWIFWLIITGLLMFMFLFGCKPRGNTGTVRRYARSMRGCGDGRYNAQVWYTDDFGEPLTGAGLRLGRVGQYSQFWCDNYEIPPTIPQGYCPNVSLKSGGITGAGGKVCITGIGPKQGANCDGHPANWGHQAHGYWGIEELCMNVGFIIGTPPPYSHIAMWPNDRCPTPDYEPPTVPTVSTTSGPVSTHANAALGAPTTGGAGAATAMIVVDPNDMTESIELPTSGFDYSVCIVRTYEDYSERELEINPSNSNEWETNYRYMFPCKYEYIVAQSAPKETVGAVYTATIRSNLIPEGVQVNAEVIAQNPAKTVSIVTTDYFLPLTPEAYIDLMNDPNEHVIFNRWNRDLSPEELPLYDPNQWEDPNDCPGLLLDPTHPEFMDRHDPGRAVPLYYLPVNDEDEITIEFHVDGFILSEFFGDWLSQSPVGDLSGDNWVDLTDFSLATQPNL